MAYNIFSSYGLDKINDMESLNRDIPDKSVTNSRTLKPTPKVSSIPRTPVVNNTDKHSNKKLTK